MILPSKNSQVLHTPDVDQNNAAFKDAMNDPASDKNKKNSKSICNCDQVGLRYIQGLQSKHNYYHSCMYKPFTALFRCCEL